MAQFKRTGPAQTLLNRYPGVRGYRAVVKLVDELGFDEAERRMSAWYAARHEDDPPAPPRAPPDRSPTRHWRRA